MKRQKGESLNRLFLLVVVFFTAGLLSSDLASASSIYSQWHHSGDSFTTDGSVFLIYHPDFYSKSVVIKIDNRTYILSQDDCKYNQYREYCVEIVSDIEASTTKFVDGKAYAGIRLIINSIGTDISVSRAFSTTAPVIDTEVTETVTVKNTGRFYPDSFEYEETFPSGVVLTSMSTGAKVDGKTIKYRLSVQPGTEYKLFYNFKLLDKINFSSIGKWSFTYAGNNNVFSFNTSIIKIAIAKDPVPYSLTASISPSSVEVQEEGVLSINLNDVNKEDDVTVQKVLVKAPSSDSSFYPAENGLVKSADGFTWSGALKPESGKVLSGRIKASKPGDYRFQVYALLNDADGKEYSESKNLSIKVALKNIEPTLSVKESSVSEGGTFRVAFSVRNPNKHISLYNINSSINSALFPSISVSTDELLPLDTKTLFIKDDFLAPSIDAKKNFEVNATVKYDASFAQRIDAVGKATITVTPVNDILSLTHAINKNTLKTGDNVTITVKVRNHNEESIVVNVKDVFSEGIILDGGKTEETLYFDKAQEQQAYVYSLVVPDSFEGNELKITSSASIVDKDYLVMKETKIPVNVTKLIIEKKPEPVQQPVVPPEKKVLPPKEKGFFEKALIGIADFSGKVVKSVSDFFNNLLTKKK